MRLQGLNAVALILTTDSEQAVYNKGQLKKRCGILPTGGLGVSSSFKSPPRLGDLGVD